MHEPGTILLTPPQLTPDHLDTLVTCLRPKHADGYQLYAQIQDSKLIFHNYGHSGSGWTLLFGVIEQLMELFDREMIEHPEYNNKPICVIGAGCMGLLSAINLAQKGYQVTIQAESFEDIASDKAVGLFFPYTAFTQVYNKYQQAQEVSLREYTQILEGAHPFLPRSTVARLPQYVDLQTKYSRLNFWGPPRYTTIDFGNGTKHDVREYNTIFIHTAHMMHHLRAHAQALGIPFIQKRVENLRDVHEPIIINCTALGARTLNNDTGLIPVQGHLITLANQPIQELQYIIHVRVVQNGKPCYLYFAPKGCGILGITYIEGEWDVNANQHEFDLLIERARTFFGV